MAKFKEAHHYKEGDRVTSGKGKLNATVLHKSKWKKRFGIPTVRLRDDTGKLHHANPSGIWKVSARKDKREPEHVPYQHKGKHRPLFHPAYGRVRPTYSSHEHGKHTLGLHTERPYMVHEGKGHHRLVGVPASDVSPFGQVKSHTRRTRGGKTVQVKEFKRGYRHTPGNAEDLQTAMSKGISSAQGRSM